MKFLAASNVHPFLDALCIQINCPSTLGRIYLLSADFGPKTQKKEYEMKTLKSFIVLIALSTVANANALNHTNVLNCASSNSQFSVSISATRNEALVVQSENGKTETVGRLACQATNERLTHPDQIITTLSCYEPFLRDAGYSLILRQGGIANISQMRLSEVSFIGSKVIASLYCK